MATHLATTEATHKLQLVSLSSKEDYDAIHSQQLALPMVLIYSLDVISLHGRFIAAAALCLQ